MAPLTGPATVRLVCGNVDSCAPGVSHLFPEEGETVTVHAATRVRVLDYSEVEVLLDWVPGQTGVVQVLHPEWHQVLAVFADRRVWLDIDDIALPS